MTTSWDLRFSVDARGHQPSRVSTLPIAGSVHRQLLVRVGHVTVGCLDGASAMSAGLAWATARWQAREWLPALQDEPWRPRPQAGSPYGGAFPAGSIVFDGRQPWQVTPHELALLVTVGPLQVTVHDWTALDAHVHAWSEASALATRLFPGKAMPFNRLVDLARKQDMRAADLQRERDRGRTRNSTRDADGATRG